ncbi:uncharacterized protein LOC122276209 [Carya illinoinensis]|uniref:uncharacterized protein LOC122276209 n=1 Tax=Carya illinoinensis TaxID=32201 RepID=UPI001C728110|nr:uncharacterized protein LOC122276209 [Carya illinoinensis]
MEDVKYDWKGVIRMVKGFILDISSSMQNFKFVGSHDLVVLRELNCPVVPVAVQVPKLIAWSPPAVELSKLNVDGGSLGNPGMSGRGGIVRNAQGHVFGGFAHCYGQATNTIAECRAFLLFHPVLGKSTFRLASNLYSIGSWISTVLRL